MTKRTHGKTGFEIAPVVFGGIINTGETQEDANRYVAYAIDRGVNYFDVAPSYGDAEERLGPALRPFRKDVFLACKTTRRDAKGSKEELIASLKRLQTDYFDVYQMHSISKAADVDEAFSGKGVMETMFWALREGVVRKAGFTAHSEAQSLRCFEQYDFDSVLFPMNWALGAGYGYGDRIAETAKAKGAGLLCMKIFAYREWEEGEDRAGAKSWYKPIELSGPLPVAAMKYGLSKGASALVPPGNFKAFRHMLDNIDEALANPLSADDMDLLKAEAEKIKGREIGLLDK